MLRNHPQDSKKSRNPESERKAAGEDLLDLIARLTARFRCRCLAVIMLMSDRNLANVTRLIGQTSNCALRMKDCRVNRMRVTSKRCRLPERGWSPSRRP